MPSQEAPTESQSQELASRIPPVTEAQAMSVFNRWLEAQDQKDFVAYESLFADKMLGIKRSGDRTYRFGRVEWLADRKKMFRKKFSIVAKDVTYKAIGSGALVEFTQLWSSANFRDEGKKVLTLVRLAGGIRIVKEEMLFSAKPSAADRLFGVAWRTNYWIVGEGDAADRANDGYFEDKNTDAYQEVVWAKDGNHAIVDELMKDGRLRVISDSGKTCAFKVGDRKLVSRADDVDLYYGDEYEDLRKKLGVKWAAYRKKELWKNGAVTRLVELELKDCGDESAAMIAESEPERTFKPSKRALSPALAMKLNSAFYALEVYKTTQADFDEDAKSYAMDRPDSRGYVKVAPGTRWHDHDVDWDLFEDGSTQIAFARLRQTYDFEDTCQRFDSEVAAAWLVDDEKLQLIFASTGGVVAPDLFFKMPNSWAIPDRDVIVVITDGNLSRTRGLPHPSFGCDC